MALENGDKVLNFLMKQRDEDVKRGDEKHRELLKMFAENSEKIIGKIDSLALETELQFKKHEKYHKDNEPIWSYNIFKWLDEHRKAVFLSGILIGMIIIIGGTYIGFNWKELLKGIIKDVK